MPLDPSKFFRWIEYIVQAYGTDILRMKGILSFEDDDDRYVVQSVHMLMEGNHQRAWKAGETRLSRLVFIGRNLPRDILTDGFGKCRALPVAAQ
jgi:G3E family GTPase